jgi:hypothetical protein
MAPASNILDVGFSVATIFLPQLSVLRVAIDQLQLVELNKDRCHYLLKRAARVLSEIDAQVKKHPPPNLRENADRLMRYTLHHKDRKQSRLLSIPIRQITYIRDLIASLASKGLIKSLLSADEISLQIDDGHHRLSDCLASFQVAAQVDAANFMTEAENARIKDERQLRNLLAQLMTQRDRDAQVLRELRLGQEDLIETMLAVQKVFERIILPQPPALIAFLILQHLLHNAGEDNTTARKVLSVGMQAIQRVSGRQAPAQVPDWVITSYDVEVEKGRKLGVGGFGIVYRGIWNGTIVAVKQLMLETNQDVSMRVACFSTSFTYSS